MLKTLPSSLLYHMAQKPHKGHLGLPSTLYSSTETDFSLFWSLQLHIFHPHATTSPLALHSYFLRLDLVTWLQTICLGTKEPETPPGKPTQASAPSLNLQASKPVFQVPPFEPYQVPRISKQACPVSCYRERERWVLNSFPSDKLQPFEGRTHFTSTVFSGLSTRNHVENVFFGEYILPHTKHEHHLELYSPWLNKCSFKQTIEQKRNPNFPLLPSKTPMIELPMPQHKIPPYPLSVLDLKL